MKSRIDSENHYHFDRIDEIVLLNALDSLIDDRPFDDLAVSKLQSELNLKSAKTVRKKLASHSFKFSAEDIRLSVMALEYYSILMDEHEPTEEDKMLKAQIAANNCRKNLEKMLSYFNPIVDKLLNSNE